MIKNIKVKASKMDLISKYSEACGKFFSYLIENNIVPVDLDVLNILLQNNLRVSLGKCKLYNMTTCKAHSKTKEPIEEPQPLEEDEIYIIRKNGFNNFVYGNTGLIFKSSTEKYIVAREGSKGEWLPLEAEDIEVCKKNGLRWKKIENKVRGETFNLEVLKKYDVFPKLEERSVQRFLNIEDDENNEN